MTRQFLSLLFTLCMAVTLVPITTGAVNAPVPTVSNRSICANGAPIIVVAGTTPDFTNILYDEDNDGTIGDSEYLQIGSESATIAGYNLSGYTIFGGAQSGTITNDSMITINSGNVGSVYGGNFSYSDMPGGVTIVMNGGSIARIIACGYNNAVGGTGKTVSVSIHGGTVRGGVNEDVDLNARNKANTTSLFIDGGVINGQITVKSGGTFVINGGTISASITALSPSPTNDTDAHERVYKTAITLMTGGTAKANTTVSELTVSDCYVYGMNDVTTDGSGKLYVYLPAGKIITAANTGSVSYTNSLGITVLNTDNAAGELTVPLWTNGLTANASSFFGGGSGTLDAPYLLSSATDIAQLAINVNNGTTYSGTYFKLTADIDLAGKYWIPIGNGNLVRSFCGIFDGNNHKITNMTIDDSVFNFNGYARYGFISWMYMATVKNLGLESASISLGASSQTAYEAALLVALMDNSCTIENCYAIGTITAICNVENIGGLVGKSYMNGTLKNCYFRGTINAVSGTYAGGLLGYLSNGATPSNCYVAASIITTATNKYAVASSANTCYYDSTLNGIITGELGTAKTTAEMKTADTATALGNAWTYFEGEYPQLKGFRIIYPTQLTITSMQITSSDNDSTLLLKFTVNGLGTTTFADWLSGVCEKISVHYSTTLNDTFESRLSDVSVQNNGDGTGTISGTLPQNMPSVFFRVVIE